MTAPAGSGGALLVLYTSGTVQLLLEAAVLCLALVCCGYILLWLLWQVLLRRFGVVRRGTIIRVERRGSPDIGYDEVDLCLRLDNGEIHNIRQSVPDIEAVHPGDAVQARCPPPSLKRWLPRRLQDRIAVKL